MELGERREKREREEQRRDKVRERRGLLGNGMGGGPGMMVGGMGMVGMPPLQTGSAMSTSTLTSSSTPSPLPSLVDVYGSDVVKVEEGLTIVVDDSEASKSDGGSNQSPTLLSPF